MLTSRYLTIKQIAAERETTTQAVYKVVRKLKKKGLLKGTNLTGFKLGGLQKPTPFEKGKKTLNLHNIQINIKIIKNSKKYLKEIKKGNKISIKGATILLFKKGLDIYTDEASFDCYTTNEGYAKAISYFTNLYSRIENKFDITINKEGYLNKKWVRQHIAERDNELAKKYNDEKKKLKIKAEDGKVWLIADKSFNGNDLEFPHPETSKPDTDKVIKHFNDIRANDPPTNSQLATHIFNLAKNSEVYIENIQKHLSVLDSMDRTMKLIRKELRGGRFLSRRSVPRSCSQSSLQSYI